MQTRTLLKEYGRGVLGQALLVLAWGPLSASLIAQESMPEADSAQFILSPSFRVGGQYNRVEGLPIMLGSALERGGPSPFGAEALVILRTDRLFGGDPDAVGYQIEVQQQWGATNTFSAGAAAHSLIAPIERWHVSDLETSLSTFFIHQDFRDHVEKTGFSVFVGVANPDGRLTGRVTYRDESHDFVTPGSPLALSSDPEPWRPQPLVGVGRVRTVSAAVVFDDRDRFGYPNHGWYLSGGVTAAVGGSLILPEYLDAGSGPEIPVADARAVATNFRRGTLEIRRYDRVGRSMNLRLRAIVTSSLGGGPLPPQFQRALGGPGSLPGYPLLSVDCGARSQEYSVLQGEGAQTVRVPAYAGYGCDGFALFQAEYGGRIPFGIVVDQDPYELEDEYESPPFLDLRPHWSVFFEVARGWSMSDPGDEAFLGPDTETLLDVGAGLAMGPLGLYWAWPLAGEKGKGNLFLRIVYRF